MSKTTRGNVVWDPCAYPSFVCCASRNGWNAIRISKSHIHLKDPDIATRYSRNNAIMFTNDYSVYIDHTGKTKFAGFIEHERAKNPSELNIYKKKVDLFFVKMKAKDILGKIYRIPINGQPYIRPIKII